MITEWLRHLPCTLGPAHCPNIIVKQQKGEGSWNVYTLNKWDTLYIPHPCSECRAKTWRYCKCDPGHPLCMACFGIHAHEHGG
jgi:hypothetical protein